MSNNELCICNPTEYPFYCTRHCKNKTQTEHKHCQLLTPNGFRYWNAWEQGSHGATAPANPIEIMGAAPKTKSTSGKPVRGQKGKRAQQWLRAFQTNCAHKGDVIHREPCSCGGSVKVDIHACGNPDIKRCVSLTSQWKKIKDKDLQANLAVCQTCKFYQPKIKYVPTTQLAVDVAKLIPKLPRNVVSVTGVARSGVAPAALLSMMLHIPLYILRQSEKDRVPAGCGWRLHEHKEKKGVNLVIDDTAMTGRSLSLVKDVLKDEKGEFLYATVYTNPKATLKPDVWAVDLPWPHLLEWNLFNSVMSPSLAYDFDGILCEDCKPIDDDDGDRYIKFINTAKPKYLPRKVSIPLIVTARIEKYRKITTEWLRKWNIRCDKLVMHPAATLEERNQDNIPKYKADHFLEWANKGRFDLCPPIFIESCDHQAEAIAAYSGKAVICPTTGKVYS